MTTLRSTKSNDRSLLRHAYLLLSLIFGFAWLALAPAARGVSPPPDGGYPNFTTAEGANALFSLTTGSANTAVGFFSLFSNSTGNFNTAVGAGALDLNTADDNTATGTAALLLNTTGTDNTATGVDALAFNDTGFENTANGAFALFSNTEGGSNTSTAFQALSSNTPGSSNTADGFQALSNSTIGSFNTADGFFALFDTTGNGNTAIGSSALRHNTTGVVNTANGFQALFDNTTGNSNTAVGRLALENNTTGFNNIGLGAVAGDNITTAYDVICIGANVRCEDVSNSCYIGNIHGQTSAQGVAVFINSNGKLGTTTSSKRFKEDIKPMDEASEAILALKPVSFCYKKEIDAERTPQFGLVAEDVEKVNPDLVARDAEGKVYTVRYEAVNAMLLNEFLKEHRTVQEQKATVAQLKQDFQSKLAQQQKQIEALSVGLQKVSAQLELSKSAPQTVLNNQ